MLFREALPDGTLDLLIGLCNTAALADFSLAGGTSLALRFGHRLSVDLNFFTTLPFDHEELSESLKETLMRGAGAPQESPRLLKELRLILLNINI